MTPSGTYQLRATDKGLGFPGSSHLLVGEGGEAFWGQLSSCASSPALDSAFPPAF